MSITIEELALKLGLEWDAQQWLKANIAFEGLRFGLIKILEATKAVMTFLPQVTLEVADLGDKIDELSQSAGVGTDELQSVAFAGRDSGLSLEDAAHSTAILARNMSAATQGNKELAKAFKTLGVPLKNADGTLRSSVDVMADVADHFSKMEDSAEKSALAFKLFGKSGTALIPTLNQGGDAIRNAADEARRMGTFLEKDTIRQAAEFDNTVGALKASLTGVKTQIGVALLPALLDASNAVLKWVDANRDLIKQKVEAFIDGVRTAGEYAVKAFTVLSELLPSVVATMSYLAIQSALAGTASALAGLKAAAAWGAAQLAAGATLAAFGALFLIVDEVVSLFTGAESQLDKIIKQLGEEGPDEPWWLGALRDALDLLKLISKGWYEIFSIGVDGWKDVINGFVIWVTGLWDSMINGLSSSLSEAFDWLPGIEARNVDLAPVMSSYGGIPQPTTVRGNTVYKPNIPITVVQQPGQSSNELTANLSKMFDKKWDQKMRENSDG